MEGNEIEMLDKHERQITEEIFPAIKQHAEDIKILKTAQKEYGIEMAGMKNQVESIRLNQMDLKNTLVNFAERQENRFDTMLKQNQEIMMMTIQADEKLESAKVAAEETKTVAKIAADKDVKVSKWATFKDVAVAVLGAGGVISLVAQFFMK